MFQQDRITYSNQHPLQSLKQTFKTVIESHISKPSRRRRCEWNYNYPLLLSWHPIPY